MKPVEDEEESVDAIAKVAKDGQTVIVESTISPQKLEPRVFYSMF